MVYTIATFAYQLPQPLFPRFSVKIYYMGAVLASLRIICSEAKKIISKIYLEESSLLALARSVLLNQLEISNNILSNNYTC